MALEEPVLVEVSVRDAEREPEEEPEREALGQEEALPLSVGEPLAEDEGKGEGDSVAVAQPVALGQLLTVAVAQGEGEWVAVAQGEGEWVAEAQGEGESEPEAHSEGLGDPLPLAEGDAVSEPEGEPKAEGDQLPLTDARALRVALLVGVAVPEAVWLRSVAVALEEPVLVGESVRDAEREPEEESECETLAQNEALPLARGETLAEGGWVALAELAAVIDRVAEEEAVAVAEDELFIVVAAPKPSNARKSSPLSPRIRAAGRIDANPRPPEMQ